jgi:hypothetical protein
MSGPLLQEIVQHGAVISLGVSTGPEIKTEVLRTCRKDSEALPDHFRAVNLFQSRITLDARDGLMPVGNDETEIAALDCCLSVWLRMGKLRIKQVDAPKCVLAVSGRKAGAGQPGEHARGEEKFDQRAQAIVSQSAVRLIVSRNG